MEEWLSLFDLVLKDRAGKWGLVCVMHWAGYFLIGTPF